MVGLMVVVVTCPVRYACERRGRLWLTLEQKAAVPSFFLIGCHLPEMTTGGRGQGGCDDV